MLWVYLCSLTNVPQTSDYPVILSLENHCSVEQQKVMAQHMSSILGPALLTQPMGDTMPTGFPSPEVCIHVDRKEQDVIKLCIYTNGAFIIVPLSKVLYN